MIQKEGEHKTPSLHDLLLLFLLLLDLLTNPISTADSISEKCKSLSIDQRSDQRHDLS